MQSLTGSGAEQRLAFLEQALAEDPNDGSGDGAYSNAGYAAAGAKVESAAGTTWEDVIQLEVARPLGLTSVGFGYPATSARPDQPRGHARSGSRVRDGRWGVIHFGAGSGGWFFVRIVIAPRHDAAVVIASNSGDAGPAARELWPRLLRQFAQG